MRIRFFLVLLFVCCGVPYVQAADSVSIRAGSHSDHDRLVIDWPSAVNETLSGTAPDYQLTFDQPVSLAVPKVAGLPRIQAIEQTSETQLAIHLKAGQHLNISHLGNKLVMDAVAGKDSAADKPPEKTAEKPSPVQLAPWSESQELSAKPSTVPKDLSKQIASQVASMNATAPTAAAPAPINIPTGKAPDAPKPAETKTPAQSATAGPGGRPLTLAELAARDADKAAAKPADNKTTDAAAADKPEPQTFTALPMLLPTPTAVAQLKLQVAKNAKFAAFMRGRKFWIVLDQPTLVMPTDEAGAEPTKFGPTTRYQVGQGTGTAYRIQLNENQYPALTKSDDGVLQFTLYSQAPLVMPVGLPIEVVNSPDSGPQLKITAPGFAQPLTVSDPDIGDQLYVVPASGDTGAVSESHRWPQLGTIGALNGVVLTPLVDNLLVDADRKGMIIALPPKGLTLSGVKGLVERHDKGNGELLFDLKRWRITSFSNFRRMRAQLESALVDVRGAERLGRITELARFMFAQGYAPEANGWLRIAALEFPTAVNIPEYVLLRGAVHVAMRDIFPADRDLSLPGYAFEPEVALWRGWAAAQNEDYPRARYFFGLARDLLNDYPDPYFKPIAMAAAETALLTGDAVAGSALISRVEARHGLLNVDKDQIQYLRGLEARLNGQPDEATKLWKGMVKSPNKIYGAKAELALIQDSLQQKKIGPGLAIEHLDHLRYQWRGDGIELATLVTLAQLYMDNDKPREAFECWQTIIRYFPNDAMAETARQNISNNLSKLFVNDADHMQKPIETLALYHDFINYAPTPQIGEQITRHLIDNLTALGLYHEAADIYLSLVQPKLDPTAADSSLPLPLPAPKNDDVLRLAGIYLLDGQAAAARNLLKTIDPVKLSAPEGSEYKLLLARADFQDNKLDDALVELGTLNDTNANRMRSDIYWRQQKWAEAAKVLPSLLGEIPADGKLSDDQTRNILEQAVATSLIGNQPAIDALRSKYGAMMDQTDQGASFRLVTMPPKGSEVQSVKSIQARLGDVDGFAKFLQGYRNLDAAEPADAAVPKADTATSAVPTAEQKK